LSTRVREERKIFQERGVEVETEERESVPLVASVYDY